MKDGLELASAAWAEASIDDALARLQRAQRGLEAGAALSFSVGSSTPELELTRELAELSGSAALSFSADQPAGDSDEQKRAEGRRVLDELVARIRAAARIETRTGDRLIAWTSIGVVGDTTTSVSRTATAAELARHQASVDQALRARQTRTRLVLSTLTAAANIALAAGAGGPLLALPAIWRFVSSVMNEWDQRERAA